jgi:branched-chain amino acid transport system substrate-binding protein
MRRSRIVIAGCALALAAALVAAVAARGTARDPIRVGVLTDCSGLLGPTKELVLAGAALPLLDRGGIRHEDGRVTGAKVGGLEIELVPACTEFTYFHLLILATRRLIEDDGVDVVLGPAGVGEGVVLRELAAHYPGVTFLEGPPLPQEATLRHSRPNLFRFSPDGAQTTAGLGTYAYRELGWRRAVVVGEGFFGDGWELAAGFVAEFCALGGEVVGRDWLSLFLPDPSRSARRHAAQADGLVVLADSSPATYLAAYGRAVGSLKRRLLLGGSAFLDPRSLSLPGVDLRGVVRAGHIPLDPDVTTMRTFQARFERVFPELPPGPAKDVFVVPFYTAMSAVVSAVEQTGGELGDGQRDFRASLSSLELAAPQGKVRLDRNRQAIAPVYLERIESSPGRPAAVEAVRTIRDVDQSFGDIFSAHTPRPSATKPACESRRPPSWAR